MSKQVVSVNINHKHTFSKPPVNEVMLCTGLGVEGDAHFGATTQHRYAQRKDPTQANLRQVHLIHAELFDELKKQGFIVGPGELGENITTQGVDLLGLPQGTILKLGDKAEIKITGLREPCSLIDDFQAGLKSALLDRDEADHLIRKSGVMAVVLQDGKVKAGDMIQIMLPEKPHQSLLTV